MSDAERLVSAAYTAAQDGSALPSFLADVARAFRAPVTCLRILDTTSVVPRYAVTTAVTPGELDLLEARTSHCNIWRDRGTPEIIAKGVSDSDSIVSQRELLGTEYYADMLRPLGIAHGLALCLKAGPDRQLSTLTINRPLCTGRFRSEEIELAKALLPHLRSAYAIMQRLSWVERRASELEVTLDRLGVGVILVDSCGRRTYGNALADEAHRIGVSSGDGLQVRCADAEVQRRLNETVRLCAARALQSPATIPVRSRAGCIDLILAVNMLEPILAGTRIAAQSIASIFIHVSEPRALDPKSTIRHIFGATHAEAAVAALLATGMSPKRCAESLDVSKETVKSHMKSLFLKTGTCRQSGLVDALRTVLRI